MTGRSGWLCGKADMETIDLITNLPRDECVRRLRAGVSSYWAVASGKPVFGGIDGDALSLRKRIYYRNSFQPTLRARLSDAPGGGTRIQGEIAQANFMPAVIAGAVIFVLAIGLVVSLLGSRGIQVAAIPPAAWIAPLASIPFFAALGVGIVYLGRAFARGEPKFLTDFLSRTLEATDA